MYDDWDTQFTGKPPIVLAKSVMDEWFQSKASWPYGRVHFRRFNHTGQGAILTAERNQSIAEAEQVAAGQLVYEILDLVLPWGASGKLMWGWKLAKSQKEKIAKEFAEQYGESISKFVAKEGAQTSPLNFENSIWTAGGGKSLWKKKHINGFCGNRNNR